MKTLNQNYTSICWYCGGVFKSNRSTAHFCCDAHRSLFGPNGTIILPLAQNSKGEYYNAEECLDAAYEECGRLSEYNDGWSVTWPMKSMKNFGYDGPFPMGKAILVVGIYLLKGVYIEGEKNGCFQLKPITELTTLEKASETFVNPTLARTQN